jgi:putative transposase
MPRKARIDIPGLLQYVIVRGIEKWNLFLDEKDRKSFVDRFSSLLEETGTDCFAWSLLNNHFHQLICCNRIELTRFMRRLLTGYAVMFNHRHRRSGHLFQNMYKSIICKDPGGHSNSHTYGHFKISHSLMEIFRSEKEKESYFRVLNNTG